MHIHPFQEVPSDLISWKQGLICMMISLGKTRRCTNWPWTPSAFYSSASEFWKSADLGSASLPARSSCTIVMSLIGEDGKKTQFVCWSVHTIPVFVFAARAGWIWKTWPCISKKPWLHHSHEWRRRANSNLSPGAPARTAFIKVSSAGYRSQIGAVLHLYDVCMECTEADGRKRKGSPHLPVIASPGVLLLWSATPACFRGDWNTWPTAAPTHRSAAEVCWGCLSLKRPLLRQLLPAGLIQGQMTEHQRPFCFCLPPIHISPPPTASFTPL